MVIIIVILILLVLIGRIIVRLWQMQELRTLKLKIIFDIKYAVCNMRTLPPTWQWNGVERGSEGESWSCVPGKGTEQARRTLEFDLFSFLSVLYYTTRCAGRHRVSLCQTCPVHPLTALYRS